ncbi:MAG: GTPase HflX, partial [Rhizobiales bacterium]|nr:GTPase HflX [Hyphomicrobiales bacterium]
MTARRFRPSEPRSTAEQPTEGRSTASRALVLHPSLRSSEASEQRSPDGRLAEAVGLAQAIDLEVVDALLLPIRQIRPATLIGTGRVDEIGTRVEAEAIDLVVVDAALSPVQQRNLERMWKTKVIDRTGLILEIFGARARTREGSLQVELAALSYQRSRLVRSWTHLERQRGGFGFVGGPGESQIELDRRRIDERMTRIKGQLEAVKRTRGLHRDARKRVPYPVVALVGYTNAGKSTLFNRLTGAGVTAKDQLFATL